MNAVVRAILFVLVLSVTASGAFSQSLGPPAPGAEPPAIERLGSGLDRPNPAALLGDAAALFARGNGLGGAAGQGGMISVGSGEDGDGRGFSVALNIMVLLTVITLVPSVMVMTTCFVRILVVLALLRQAIGTQAIPPAQVVTGLALFLTAMVMAPTIDRVWDEAVVPYNNGQISDYGELWDRAKQPIRDYMFDQIEATGNWSSVYMLLDYRGVDTSNPGAMTRADVDMTVLVPAYMLSELKVGFLMGFRVYLPFLVIDMVIASILISMSMMMLPPVLISLPFKLLLFVLVDGWTLVVGSMLESFVQEGVSTRASAQAAMVPLLLIPFALKDARAQERAHPSTAMSVKIPIESHRLRSGLLLKRDRR